MQRQRLRPKMTPEQLSKIYAHPHRHSRWDDHKLRVAISIEMGKWALRNSFSSHPQVMDLSCGDATIPKALTPIPILGDFAPGYEICGPIEETLDLFSTTVELFICSETIEHLDDPDTVLQKIRERAKQLLISTPINETFEVGNQEHYWSWSVQAVGEMLRKAGWDETVVQTTITLPGWTYDYQIWVVK